MLHPFVFARTTPDKPAVIMAGSGQVVTYSELEVNANRNAHLLRSLGLKRGDTIAAMFANEPEIFDIASAAERAGLYFTGISTRLTADEAEYIIRDSGAKAFFCSSQLGPIIDELGDRLKNLALFIKGSARGPYRGWEQSIANFPGTPIEDESRGEFMLYSSGTTGNPKGVKRALPENGIMELPAVSPILTDVYKADASSIYLCPAPLYHAAPIGWSMMIHRIGGTVVVMEKFDAEDVLRLIERYSVTIAQFVPTHFIRMLKLDEETRNKYDLSSLRTIFHAAAPCPVPIKEAMFDWVGPIIHEYYAGTEGNGATIISPSEWHNKKGSVGRPIGCEAYACDDEANPLPQGETGQIYFSGGAEFEYHNDVKKTDESRNSRGWSTLGDVGFVDADGYLYLTDRKSFMIISGGVNIYPQEIENLLVTHPKVMDAAVIGAPDPDFGERVVAVIEPMNMADTGPELADELRDFCRRSLSGVKTPKQFDFTEALPRHATGKLYKRLLRDKYWENEETRV